jgi:hypothetical protein
MDPGMIPVVRTTPHLEHRCGGHPVEQELLKNDPLQVAVVDLLLPRQISIAESATFVETAFGELLTTTAQDSKPHPRVETGLCIAMRPGIDRDSHMHPEAGIERDPKVIGMTVVNLGFDPPLEIASDDTH